MKKTLSYLTLLCGFVSSLSADEHISTDDLIIGSNLDIYTSGLIRTPITISLPENFNGNLCRALPIIYNDFQNPYLIKNDDSEQNEDTSQRIELNYIFDSNGKDCLLFPSYSIESGTWTLVIPEGFFDIKPEYGDNWGIQNKTDEELRQLNIVGAWKCDGDTWRRNGIFSIIDDDGIDGQISSSMTGAEDYGYFSILFPLLESLGLRGNLALEGRRAGLAVTPPELNGNGVIAKRLQDIKGWEVMAHSMECIGERLNNWIVDSIHAPLAEKLLSENKPGKNPTASISIYDLQTHKQYHLENSGWVVSESRHIKPYAGHYDTKKPAMFNPDYDSEWAWGELAKRANDFGINMRTFVTHNTSSSHAMVREIQKYLKYGFSDLTLPYYNMPPMLSTATRFAVEGTTLPGYKGEADPDNTFNTENFKIFKGRIDEAAEAGGWVAFNLHAYRKCWKNSLPGKLVSEGGSYPDEWVIPILETDILDDQLNPPARLGIKSWKEWYPCPGTKLEMLYELLKYALAKGMINVTASEGFDYMGNTEQEGYYSAGIKIGSDVHGLQSTSNNYPHYIKGANGAVDYYNPLISDEIISEIEVSSLNSVYNPCQDCEFEAVSISGIVKKISSVTELSKGIWIINGYKIIIQ